MMCMIASGILTFYSESDLRLFLEFFGGVENSTYFYYIGNESAITCGTIHPFSMGSIVVLLLAIAVVGIISNSLVVMELSRYGYIFGCHISILICFIQG